jgi:GNAT superfamily N-acetyltransferase
VSRFGIREAGVEDAAGIAITHVESWRTSYRGILPEAVLDRMEIEHRADKRREILADRSVFQLVAYDLTHGDIVGFCDAGRARRRVRYDGEVYALYMMHHAKRHGLGTLMFERVQAWLNANDMHSMIVWVLENNHHARRFYEAMGGRPAATLQSRVSGFPVIERSYVWDRI